MHDVDSSFDSNLKLNQSPEGKKHKNESKIVGNQGKRSQFLQQLESGQGPRKEANIILKPTSTQQKAVETAINF